MVGLRKDCLNKHMSTVICWIWENKQLLFEQGQKVVTRRMKVLFHLMASMQTEIHEGKPNRWVNDGQNDW